ncbi:ABC transporter permease [Anaerorhabdus sp.]|uniref:ABC transporter permease n=1 Tax=Anaerorhabdus sp. TaxID=1872524 RepID=UPI002FC60E83
MISIEAIVLMTISTAVPLIFASLGGVLSERAGVTNIGIEGMILFGAFCGMAVSFFTNNPILGVLAAAIGGGLLALIHAFISISCGGPQAVSATGITLFSAGITSFGLRLIFNRAGNSDPVAYLPTTEIFRDIPVIGKYMANFSPLLYLAIIVSVGIWYLFRHTPLGLRIHTVGENPKVAETLGINVWRIRYWCVIVSGMLAGLGGAYLSLGQMNIFQENMSAGRGYLALAAVILGRWKPLGAISACLFFSVFDAIQLQLQATNVTGLSPTILSAIPYVVCLLVLAFSFGKSKAPAANGKPYLKKNN